MTDADWMRLALAQAREALAAGEVPVGAVLVRNGELLAAGRNRREETGDPTAHAELEAMRAGAAKLGDWRLRGCTLYVTLEPCPMCAGALAMSPLDRCVFGAPDPQKGCCGSVYDLPADPALGARCRWTAGVLEAECRGLMDGFFRGRRAENP